MKYLNFKRIYAKHAKTISSLREEAWKIGLQPRTICKYRRFQKGHHVSFKSKRSLCVGTSAPLEQIYMHSPEGEPPTYCSLFNHMVKAGGSSVKDRLLGAAKVDGVRASGDKMHTAVYSVSAPAGYTNSIKLKTRA